MTKDAIPVAGDKLSDGFPSVEKIVKATCGATVGEVLLITGSGDIFDLITVPKYAQVTDVGWMVDLAFTSGVDLSIGDSDDGNGWAEIADIAATVVDTGIQWASRMYNATDGTSTNPAYALTTPLYSTAGKDLQVISAVTTAATGKLSVYVKYHMGYGQKHF